MSTYQEVGGTEVRLVIGVRLILSYMLHIHKGFPI